MRNIITVPLINRLPYGRSEPAGIEHIVELEPDLESFMAEPDIEAKKGRDCLTLNRRPKPNDVSKSEKFNCPRRGMTLPASPKTAPSQTRKDLPLILRVVHHLVAIAEAKRAKAAKVIRPTEDRLQIERRLLASVGIGEGGLGAQRESPRLVQERDELLKIQIGAPESIRAEPRSEYQEYWKT